MTDGPIRVRIVGTGRAGGSFSAALTEVGCRVELVHRDHPDPGRGVDLVLCCVPDAVVGTLVPTWPVHVGTVVAHCAGSLGLEVLGAHPRVASLHPLVSLPDPDTGAERLRGAWFAVAGDPLVSDLVASLGGTAVEVGDLDRATYHAAAVVASNHLVALMGQVERLAASVGVPLEAFVQLASGSLANVAATGPAAALTGPVARADWATVLAHLDVLGTDEQLAYRSLAEQAAQLVGPERVAELRGVLAALDRDGGAGGGAGGGADADGGNGGDRGSEGRADGTAP